MNFEYIFISNNESENETDKLAFHDACDKGNLRVVKYFLAQPRFDWNVSGFCGSTGFHHACAFGKLNVVQFLLQQGFDINIVDKNGRTGFSDACTEGELNVVEYLLQQGVNMNVGDIKGRTGFHHACAAGRLNVIQFLVQRGFDMNVGDNDGKTGFHFACGNGKLNVVRFLVQPSLECINEPGVGGMTGLEMLIRRYYVHSDKLFMACVLLLIEAGAKLNENYVFEELIFATQNRIIEITFIKEAIFEKWTGRIAQVITDFTMEPFTNISVHNLSQFFN